MTGSTLDNLLRGMTEDQRAAYERALPDPRLRDYPACIKLASTILRSPMLQPIDPFGRVVTVGGGGGGESGGAGGTTTGTFYHYSQMGPTFAFDASKQWLQLRGPTTFAPTLNSTPASEILFSEDGLDVYENGHVATRLSDEDAAQLIALNGTFDGAGSDGTLRLGSVVVTPSGSWDHPAAGDLDGRSRRVWSLVGDYWASLPAWARRAR